MSGDAPVDPAEVPVYTGNLETLELKVTALSTDGANVATAAGDVHKSFGGLRAYYEAPEAEQLFATTQPVVDKATTLSSDMCTIAGALGTYARDIRPLVARLTQLRADAEAFRARVADDDDWREDGDLIEENLNRRNEIAEVWTQFQAAERAAHAKIVGLVGGKALTVNDGSNGEGMYGYDAEALKQSKSLPWGDAVEESVPWWQVWEHAWDFTKGVVVDGMWAGIKGLGTLVGFDGWDAAGQAWVGLGKLATGLAITLTPVAGTAYWLMPEDKLPGWLRDSRTAVKETGKAMVAWDQWESNPSRAAGAAVFNVVTTIFTGGAGGAASGAGKAGTVARVISFAGKAGRALDPATVLFKGASAGVSKIGDVMAGLRGMGRIDIPAFPEGTITLPEGTVRLPDGTVRLPEGAAVPSGAVEVPSRTVRLPEGTPVPSGAVDLGDGMVRLPEGARAPSGSIPVPEGTVKLPENAVTLPEGTVRLPEGGSAAYMDPKGNLYDADGGLLQSAKDAPAGSSAAGNPATGADTPRVEAPVREPALVGAGARAADNAGAGSIRLGDGLGDVGRVGDDLSGAGPRHVGDNLGGTGRVGDNLPGGRADNLPGGHADGGGRGPSASHETPTSSGHAETPGSGHTETPSGHHGDTPGGGHGDNPGGGGTDGPGGPPHDPPGGGTGGSTDGPSGWERPDGEPQPMPRGGELEQQIRDQMKRTKVKPDDLERVLTNLANHPAGREIAQTIASGRFAGLDGYDQVVSSLSHADKMSGGIEQLRLGNRLHASGHHDISFELKGGVELKPGVVTGEGTDLDVMARDTHGNVHGYQFKEIQNPKRVVKKIFENMQQLGMSNANFKTFVVDTKGTLAEHATLRTAQRLTDVYGKTNVQFIIRVEDGVLVIPPNGTFMPEASL